MKDWLKIAKDAYAASTSYVDSNYRKKWDDALRMFQSRHPTDSKYNTEAYKHRSKLFRPKTRSLVRKHEAAVAAAFFSNQDVISTAPMNQSNKAQAASSDIMKEILQYRLTKTIPWFQLVCGAMQDAMTIGVVCSYQYWKYKEKDKDPTYEPIVDEMGLQMVDEDGLPMLNKVPQKEVIEDKPCIELIPVENLRFDPGASWIDPVGTSPYFIRMIPMYICDIKDMMESGDKETGKEWKKLTDEQIRSAGKNENDQTRQTREKSRQDSMDASNAPLTDYEIAWVHENFIRDGGEEVVYFTLGGQFLLTEPVPIKDIYFTGERPIVMGTCVIETHKVMPDSPVLMAENLQREVNEIANQRIDNVKLVLNKRYIVKRGAQVDLKSIVRNVPASITLANNPIEDVRTLEFNDVTGSSYQEQDRLNVDYDELTGNFSQGSVLTNRKMNETVGGMGMISDAANQITEYTIRTFTETWVEPVLKQLVKLEQKYETDEVVLAVAASQAKLLEKYGVSQINDELLNQELTLNVNVGMGATNPMQKLQKFVGALKAYADVSHMQVPNLDLTEAGKEIFGLAGYRDGARFTKPAQQDQQTQMMMQQANQAIQQAKQEIFTKEQALQKQSQDLALKQKDIDAGITEINNAIQELDLRTKLAQEKLENTKMDLQNDFLAKNAEINNIANNKLSEINTAEMSKVDVDGVLQNVMTKAAQYREEEARRRQEELLRQQVIEQERKQALLDEQLAAKNSVKSITIQAPSGGVYTGTIANG